MLSLNLVFIWYLQYFHLQNFSEIEVTKSFAYRELKSQFFELRLISGQLFRDLRGVPNAQIAHFYALEIAPYNIKQNDLSKFFMAIVNEH